MKKILLNNNKFVLIDNEDFEIISSFKWYYHTTGYARTSTPKKIYMHRLILKANKKEQVDHINGDRLDNRRMNLRLCTEQQNHFNITKHKDNKSGFKGISWDSSRSLWVAHIQANKKLTHIGRFANKLDAIKAYNSFAKELHGEFAKLNQI